MLKGDLLANRVYELFGPVAVWIGGHADEEMRGGLQKRGIGVDKMVHGSVRLTIVGPEAATPEAELLREHRYWAFYCSENAASSRGDLDRKMFDCGLERAPITAMAAPFESLDKGEPWWAVYQRRVDDDAGEGFLSTPGKASDALMARYAYATHSVRPGDRVLVIGRDMDGRRFVSDLTAASAVLSAQTFEWGGDHSTEMFDVIIDVEHATKASRAGIAEAMKPAGILLTTRDYGDWDGALTTNSVVCQRTSSPRAMSTERGDTTVTSFRKPFIVTDASFRNTADILEASPAQHLLDFGRYYVFPNAIRAIANKQYRSPDVETLRRECHGLLENVSLLSADAGEALCVLSYASNGFRFAVEDQRVQEYLQIASTNPHVIRWQISLASVRADAHMAAGDFEAALASWDTCLSYDASLFHPSILTKQVGACIKAAHISVAAGDGQKAARYLQHGSTLARGICGVDPDVLFGTQKDPRFFHFGEIAEVLILSSRCAYAYEHWQRGGIDGLRLALASSSDLFRAPRSADLRDIALQKDIIERQSQRILELEMARRQRFGEPVRTFQAMMAKIVRRIRRGWSA